MLRLPNVVSRAPIGYDDGVYLSSVVAMRHGELPFRDVFSSQGPAFLPLLWLGDLAGCPGGLGGAGWCRWPRPSPSSCSRTAWRHAAG